MRERFYIGVVIGLFLQFCAVLYGARRVMTLIALLAVTSLLLFLLGFALIQVVGLLAVVLGANIDTLVQTGSGAAVAIGVMTFVYWLEDADRPLARITWRVFEGTMLTTLLLGVFIWLDLL